MIISYRKWSKSIEETIKKWEQALKYAQRNQKQRAFGLIRSSCPLCVLAVSSGDGCTKCIVIEHTGKVCFDNECFDAVFDNGNYKVLSERITTVIRELKEMLVYVAGKVESL